MAGHSHWAGIKRKKAVVGKRRGMVIGPCVRRISSAARRGGGDPDADLS